MVSCLIIPQLCSTRVEKAVSNQFIALFQEYDGDECLTPKFR